jgi:hypothetical protein
MMFRRSLNEVQDSAKINALKKCTTSTDVADCRDPLFVIAVVVVVMLIFCVCYCRFFSKRRRSPAVDELGYPLLNGADEEYDDEGIPRASNLIERLLDAMKLNRRGWRTLGMIDVSDGRGRDRYE